MIDGILPNVLQKKVITLPSKPKFQFTISLYFAYLKVMDLAKGSLLCNTLPILRSTSPMLKIFAIWGSHSWTTCNIWRRMKLLLNQVQFSFFDPRKILHFEATWSEINLPIWELKNLEELEKFQVVSIGEHFGQCLHTAPRSHQTEAISQIQNNLNLKYLPFSKSESFHFFWKKIGWLRWIDHIYLRS